MLRLSRRQIVLEDALHQFRFRFSSLQSPVFHEGHDELFEVVQVALHVEQDLVQDFAFVHALRGSGSATGGAGQTAPVGLRQIAQERVGIDAPVGFQNAHLLRHVFQLTDVARPWIVLENFNGFVVQTQGRHAVLLTEIGGELPKQQMHITSPLPQGRELNGHLAQTVVQVFPEPSARDGVVEIHVGRGHDPDVGFLDFGRTDLEELACFQNAQQTDLCCQRQFSHFIQKNGAAVGLFEIALACVRGAREGAFFVAKQFRIDGALRDGAAVDRHVGPVFSGAELMHNPRHHLFSRAALAQHQDADVRGRNLSGHRQRSVQRGGVSDHPKTTLQCSNIHAQLSAFSSVTSPIRVTAVLSKVFTLTYCPGLRSPFGKTTTVLCVVRPKN